MQGFLLAWAIVHKEIWEVQLANFHDAIQSMLTTLLPEMQPRWLKGMTTVVLTNAIVSITYILIWFNGYPY